MVGYLAVTSDVFETGELVRKNGREQVFRFHALDRRRDSSAAALTRKSKRASGVPSPADREHGRIEERLDQKITDGVAVKIPENFVEWKGVLRAEGKNDGVIGGRGLQFEIKRTAKSFSK